MANGLWGLRMRAYPAPETKVPCGIALGWMCVDLSIAAVFRSQQLALETCRDWTRVLCNKRREEE